jgi:hypothetical protein
MALGEHAIALHLVLEPAPVLGSEIELEEQLERPVGRFEPGVPVRPDVQLPSSGTPALTVPLRDAERTLGRASHEDHPRERSCWLS